MDDAPPDPIPAATLVVFRDRADGDAELLIVERAPTMAFAPGALVFPGGRVDPGDRALAATLGGDPDDGAGRIAAIRETIEEAGIAIGLTPMPGAAALTELRAMLAEGVAFGVALARVGCAVAPDALTPFARWLPRHRHVRIFDARFYLAVLPADAPDPVVDATEHSRVFWASARAVLAMCDRGEAQVIFPTRRNLERLARHRDFAAALADAAAHPVRTVTPWIEDRGGVRWLRIPDDLGYPVTSEPLDTAMRG